MTLHLGKDETGELFSARSPRCTSMCLRRDTLLLGLRDEGVSGLTSKVANRTCVVLAQFPSLSIMLPKSSTRTSLAMAYFTCGASDKCGGDYPVAPPFVSVGSLLAFGKLPNQLRDC